MKSIMLKPDDSRAKERRLKLLPRWRKSRIATELASRAHERRLKLLPRVTKSSTLSAEPNRANPRTDTALLKRA
jgi:hypothetical protein